ncbi:unnamed protein product [Penicillium palitans]
MQLEILQSGVIHIFVGKEKMQFSIHRALEGSFPDSALQPSMIEDVDEVVFACCCEFVYSGDYYVPSPTSNLLGSDTGQPRTEEVSSQPKLGRWDARNLIRNIFHPMTLPRIYGYLLEKLDQAPRAEAAENSATDHRYSYANVFMCHAEINRFAYNADWTSLRVLSLHRLIQSLEHFELSKDRTREIIGLLQFCFEDKGQIEDMQTVLRDYVVWNVEVMMQDTDFSKLLERVPSLQKAVFRSMWN